MPLVRRPIRVREERPFSVMPQLKLSNVFFLIFVAAIIMADFAPRLSSRGIVLTNFKISSHDIRRWLEQFAPTASAKYGSVTADGVQNSDLEVFVTAKTGSSDAFFAHIIDGIQQKIPTDGWTVLEMDRVDGYFCSDISKGHMRCHLFAWRVPLSDEQASSIKSEDTHGLRMRFRIIRRS